MRNPWLCGALLASLVGCGASSGSGAGGTNGAAGARSTGGTSGAGGGTGGAGTAGASGGAGSGGTVPLAAGTYAGSATGANCVGFAGVSGCSVQLTITGGGPAYEVSGFTLPGGIAGAGNTITQSGGDAVVDLLTDSTISFCPNTEYMGTGTVGASGTSMSVTLTGPPCGSSNSVFISVTLTKQ